MGRLIDANKLILHLNDYALQESPSDNESTEERRISEMVYKVIQNCIKAVEEQPTAYNVDAVVAELEYKKEKCEEDRKYWAEHGWRDTIIYNECDLNDRKVDLLDDAIDIVRKGGAK